MHQYEKIQHYSDQHMQSSLMRKDLDRLQNDVSQYLITIDLILGNGQSYLLDGATKKGSLMLQQLQTITENPMSSKFTANLKIVHEALTDINQLLETAATLSSENRDSELFRLLTLADETSIKLIKTLNSINKVFDSINQEIATRLEQQKNTADFAKALATTVFSLLILALWYWANRQISKPLVDLTDMANNVEKGITFTGVPKGPAEVLELSDCLTKLTGTLTYQARHDPLTNLFNRREFERQLLEIVYKANNEEISARSVLCYLDLDLFKAVNDTCGHEAGDELLKMVASILKKNIRSTDIVARIGGDEFCTLLIGCNMEIAMKICHQVRADIENLRFHWEDQVFRISVSTGLTYISGNGEDPLSVLNAADAACRVAKETGRNKIHVFDLDDRALSLKRHEMLKVNQLNLAIDEGRFTLFRQLIVPLADTANDRNHYEILIRMQSPDKDPIPPGTFLPLVERYHLGARLDQLVIDMVFDWLTKHPADLAKLELCSINLSGQSIGSQDILDLVITKLEETGIPGEKICFEITETAAITDLDNAKIFIHKLRALGCRFALDDFGSGISSFGYLKNLPVDFIKIDGSFIKDILNDEVDRATVKSISEVARTCDKQTIAEFVESKEIAESLKPLGIDFAQGYHFGKPEPLTSTSKHTEKNAPAFETPACDQPEPGALQIKKQAS